VKGRGDRSVLAFAQAIVPLCRRHGVPVLVNDRADLARAADADGVHVGADDLPPLFARVVTGPGARVGTSTHTLDELRTAIAAGGADHLGFGPVYASTTKSGHADVTGLDRLAAACAASRLPIVAIGGITSPERCARATRAGASLVATASAFAHPGEARVMARRLSIAFTAARSARMEA
jgi:thiamine-phosphate pyrophosphorylase